MKIGIANDHSAVDMKKQVVEYLVEKGYEVVNYGTDSYESCPYPKYGEKIGKAVADGEVDLAFGARVIGIEMAKMILDTFLGAEFLGGRHQDRVDMIMAIEENQ